MVKLIWAADKNNAIGNAGDLLWHIPEDLKFFKQKTEGGVVVMGRKTFDSLPVKPLPDRVNVVLSRSGSLDGFEDSVVVCSSVNEVLDSYPDAWVIGGGMVYDLFLPFASELFVTEVDFVAAEVDTFAPSRQMVDDFFVLADESEWFVSARNGLRFRFKRYLKQ